MRTLVVKDLLKIHFNVEAMPQAEFDEWVEEVQETAEPINRRKI